MKRASLTVIFLILFSFGQIVLAQGLPVGPGLDITASTNNPVPGQKVTITVRSYSIDINTSTIVWSLDGKVVSKGIGLTTYEVIAPTLGKKINVNISVTTANGQNISGTIGVSSGAVDLIIENNGYVPPFYKGKLPTSYQNNVRVIAVPHIANSKGVEYDPKTLTYQWKKNSRIIEDQSGYGKQAITLVGDIVPRPYTLVVTASTKDGSAQAVGYISVDFGSPWLTFYKDDPLFGPLYNLAIDESTHIGSQRETSILSVPYGFNLNNGKPENLTLTWLINGTEHPELSQNRSITLRAPSDQAGSSDIELRIQNSKNILQDASRSFSAAFTAGAANSSSL